MTRRGQQCTVCSHRERAALDLALARSVSMGALARRYSLGEDALYRHRKNHLTPALKAKLLAGPSLEGVDLDRLREVEGQSLLQNLIAIRQRLFAALDFAEEHGDANQTARVTSQLHKNLEITGALLGELNVGGQHVTNILIQPQYLTLRVNLLAALAPFPEARQAVAAALHGLEVEAAASITADANRLLAS
jgi:hypothetical protein